MPPSRPSFPGPSTMERFALGLLVVAQLVLLFLAGRALSQAESCPFHCICQNLSDSLSTLCTHKGLLSVPPHIDRRTVELRLADNFIGTVESADFLNMSGLVELTLSRNALVTLGPLAFGDLESLRSLHLDGNRLARIPPEALRGLLNLQHLILNNNQLEEIAAEAFDDFLLTLEDLDLAYNNLRQVPWAGIGAMLCLHTLNLDHNLIEAVAEGALGQLEQLSRLDMTSNRLHTLPPDPLFARAQVGVPGPPTTPWAPALSLSFGGNPLHCNCELLWLRRLARPDDLETCASPAAVAGRYFWSVPEEEFTCEPPLITRHTHTLWVLEGQRATLRCRAIGDPEPTIHWVSPDDKIVGNSSRTASFRNGTLDLLVTTLRDGGGYTCIAINAAGEATAPVGLKIIPLPHRGGGGHSNATAAQADPGSSDITTSAKAAANAAAANASEEGEAVEEGGVEVSEVTATSALVRWGPERPAFAAWMYQIQYNCTADETLVYRIIPATLRHFRLKHLVPGADYTLCLLAIFDDVATSLAATHLLGCAHFATREAYPDCRALQAHFLGGTLTVIVGGVLVASLLVFTVVMMVKHKVCGSTHGGSGGAHPLPKVTHVHSQTNGGHPNGGQRLLLQRTPPKEHSGPSRVRRPEHRAKAGAAAWCLPPGAKAKRSNSLDMAEASPNACYGYAKRLSFLWSKRSQSVHGMLAQGGTGSMEDDAAVAATQRIGPFLNTDELEESVV